MAHKKTADPWSSERPRRSPGSRAAGRVSAGLGPPLRGTSASPLKEFRGIGMSGVYVLGAYIYNPILIQCSSCKSILET